MSKPATEVLEQVLPPSQLKRILNIFFAPAKTFTDMRQNTTWWLPWLLIMIFTIGYYGAVGVRVGWTQAIRNVMEKSPRAMERDEKLTAEQRQQLYSHIDAQGKLNIIIAPLVRTFALIITASVFLSIFNFGFDAEYKFKKLLCIVVYSSLPLILEKAIAIGLLFADVALDSFIYTNPLGANLGFYLDMANVGQFWYSLAASVDLFTLWIIGLMGLGISKTSKVRLVPATLCVIAAYAAFTLVGALLSSASM